MLRKGACLVTTRGNDLRALGPQRPYAGVGVVDRCA
jgi:hypothetical protein